jgi:hypothetical protein
MPTEGPLDVTVHVGVFWLSREEGQVNITTLNDSSGAIPGLELHCTVTSEKIGSRLADQVVSVGAIPAGEQDVQSIGFSVKSETTPGFFKATCVAPGIEAVSTQIYGPGSQTELPVRPNRNDTSACTGALQSFDSAVVAYLPVRSAYLARTATYAEFARAYSAALMAYYVAANACR